MTNHVISSIWAAACPRPAVSLRGHGLALAPLTHVGSAGYASLESGRERLSGIDLQAPWHFRVMSPAVQTIAQVKGADKRAVTGPYPWRPKE